jgi:hypothetical protein
MREPILVVIVLPRVRHRIKWVAHSIFRKHDANPIPPHRSHCLSPMEIRRLMKQRSQGPSDLVIPSFRIQVSCLTSSNNCIHMPHDAADSEPRWVFLPYLLQLSVTRTHRCPKCFQSAHLELSFSGVTSRPDVHAIPQKPLSSF